MIGFEEGERFLIWVASEKYYSGLKMDSTMHQDFLFDAILNI